MKKWKGFIYIKLLVTVLFAASVVIGTYSVVVLSDDSNRQAAADVLEGKEGHLFEEGSYLSTAVSYYKEAFENYLQIRRLLDIDESGKLDYNQVIIYNLDNANKGYTLSDIVAQTNDRGEVYESLSIQYDYLQEGVLLHNKTVKKCVRKWNRLKNNGFQIGNKRYVFDGSEQDGVVIVVGDNYNKSYALDGNEKGQNEGIVLEDMDAAAGVVNDLIQCYDFYTELFEQDSNFSYMIFDYGKCRKNNGTYIGSEYEAYKYYIEADRADAGYLAVYDPYEKKAESDILGISAQDLRYDTHYLAEHSVELGKNGTSLAAEMYDKENSVAIAVRIDYHFPKDDVFKALYEKYTDSHALAKKYVPVFARCAAVALLSLLFLIYACGRLQTTEENGVQKTRYVLLREEKCFTELFFFGFIISSVCTLYVIDSMVFDGHIYYYYAAYRDYDAGYRYDYGSRDMDIYLAVFMISALILFSCLLFIYNIKKIKARRFFKDTVAGTLFRMLKDENGKLYRWIKKEKEFFRNMGEDKKGIKKILFFDLAKLTCAGMVFIFFLFLMDGWGGGFFFLIILGAAAYLYLTVKFHKWIINSRAADRDIVEGATIIADGNLEYKISDENAIEIRREMIDVINRIGEGLANAVADGVKSERMKTELITNVSHDIKTPLTSVINYVDLLKRENIEDEKIQGYLEVLDNKSQRLKVLIEDLIEASKASSGAIQLIIGRLNFNELVSQTDGEFSERFAQKNLALVSSLAPEPLIIEGDGRRIYRILENLYQNVNKYAMEGTRVYVELKKEDNRAVFTIKNISKEPLNISAAELTERFVRGEESRTTEGSGLGLSIAKSLTELHKGEFEIYMDGDLFRVTVSFPLSES